MDQIQEELDSTTERLEDLRTDQENLLERIALIESTVSDLQDRRQRLLTRAEERADFLYRQGSLGMLEVLVVAEDFGELLARADLAARVSAQGNQVFFRLAREKEELDAYAVELEGRRAELDSTTSNLADTVDDLQAKLAAAADEYHDLKKELAAERVATVPAARGSTRPTADAPVHAGGKACPVNGPVSFIDSWGAPRVGHTHVGVDMMADYGTPLVAIVSGTISAGSSSTGGNSLFLSGDDGNSYWYLHNQQNLVTSGHVSAGQQIGTVGDTGNAVGIPHLHFEYHPGGGGPVNPYPLVAAIC